MVFILMTMDRKRVHCCCNCAWFFQSLPESKRKQNKVTLYGDLQRKQTHQQRPKKGCYICRSVVEHHMVPPHSFSSPFSIISGILATLQSPRKAACFHRWKAFIYIPKNNNNRREGFRPLSPLYCIGKSRKKGEGMFDAKIRLLTISNAWIAQ